MNDPARQASPLLARLASRPVANSLLRSTLSGLSPSVLQPTDNLSSASQSSTQLVNQSSTTSPSSPSLLPTTDSIVHQNKTVLSTIANEDLVDDDTKLALFDSVLDELYPLTSTDTISSDNPSSQKITDDALTPDTFEIADPRLLRGRQVSNDDIVAQPDPLVSMMSQSMPSDQFLPDTLNISPPPTSSRRAPESIPAAMPTAEVPGITVVEQEPNNLEIPVEVEGFLERVADHTDKLPQEIVIQGNDIALNQVQPIKKAVIMLPISEEDEKQAKGKNPTWSIAWLVNWSQKIIKKFTGQVVYSQNSAQITNS